MKYINLIIVLLVSTICFGCIAKSSVVDENSERITEIATIVKKYHNKDKNIDDLISKAIATEIKGSNLVSKEVMDKGIGFATTQASRILGFDASSVVSGLMSFILLGSAGLILDRKKRRKQLDALASMTPEEANKVKDVI